MRLLLLQARREEDPVQTEERESFARAGGLETDAIVGWNVVTRGVPSWDEASRHDALLVGGSGDFLVSNGDMPYFGGFLGFLREVVGMGFPMFASCFGFQCLVEALGGHIVYDPENAEVGTYDVRLTHAGVSDPLLGVLPQVFRAQLGRKDRAERLPEGVVNLAESRLSPSQALRIPGQPIWASQFHPELTEETNRQRFRNYLRNYESVMAPGALRGIPERFGPSPEAGRILSDFVAMLDGGGASLYSTS
jgi:GMP synthase (glutamine-hydrolysing)